jgi:uncharacterized SAM-dependent methyltransferase
MHEPPPHAPLFLELSSATADAPVATPADEARASLMAPEAHLSPKFFYDPLGSRLFDAITELDEYYPTRTEAAILQGWRSEIATRVHARLGPAPVLVDLGAGNCAKAAGLFSSLQPSRYVAVDISVDFLRQSLVALQRQHPDIRAWGRTSPRGWRCPPACCRARRWCSTRAPASATSARPRRCGCCARCTRKPPAVRC